MSKLDFKTWFKFVDLKIKKTINISLDDLPDNTFWDDWNNGLSINDMASKVVKDTLWEDYYKEQLENQK